MKGTPVPGWLRTNRKSLGPGDVRADHAKRMLLRCCCDDCCEARRVGVVSVHRGQLTLRDLGVQGGETPGPRAVREGFRSLLALSCLSCPQLSLETGAGLE